MSLNFLEAQARNRRRTAALVAVLTALLVAACWVFQGWAVGRLPSAGDDGVPWAGVAALVGSGLYALGSYFFGARALLFAARGRPARPTDPRERVLLNVVEEMTIAAGLPRPEVWVLPDGDLNAFATGRDPAHAAIAVTEGMLDLPRDQLQAVVAHELGHVRNRDTLLLLFVTCMLGALLLLTEIMLRGRGARRRRDGLAILVAVAVAWVLARLVGRVVAMAVSREREYLADATAAELTRNPAALADALRAIQRSGAPTAVAYPATAALFIGDPSGDPLGEREGRFAGLLSTHPPMELRIRRLEAMAFADAKRRRRTAGLDPLAGADGRGPGAGR